MAFRVIIFKLCLNVFDFGDLGRELEDIESGVANSHLDRFEKDVGNGEV